MPGVPGQERSGLGKPTRKMGRVKRGSRGAESRADSTSSASRRGKSTAFTTSMALVDWRRCLVSVQEVTMTVRAKRSLETNWEARSISKPIWQTDRQVNRWIDTENWSAPQRRMTI